MYKWENEAGMDGISLSLSVVVIFDIPSPKFFFLSTQNHHVCLLLFLYVPAGGEEWFLFFLKHNI